MLQEKIQKITQAVDEKELISIVREISRYHRIQASPGFRAAAQYCHDRLANQGIDAQVLSFHAKERRVFDTYPSFQEWSCQQAWCELSTGRRIADFESEPMSVIQRSIPCDYRCQPLPIVWLDKGADPTAYEEDDLAGKLVFVRDDFNKYYWAVTQKHAAGFLTDFVQEVAGSRSRCDQLDILRYTSFWWEKGVTKCFGFVLSPREGDLLAQALTESTDRGETLTASCYIDSALYDGYLEDVTAVLPGTSDEEVLLTAHLCHPQSSANDNASGVAAAMEAIRIIRDLTANGTLPPLKRSIRILLVPEFTGSYAYIQKIGEQRGNIIAGMNLDMVGGRQDAGYGPLTITDLPHSTPSIVCDLAAVILEEIKKEVPTLSGELLPMFNSHIGNFTGGSDHIVFTDPQVGIPSLMLGQWPDKFYHTSGDTVEQIDPHLLGRSCALAAAYAYILATLEPDDLFPIFSAGAQRAAKDFEHLKLAHRQGQLSDQRFQDKAMRRLDWVADCIESCPCLFSEEDTARVKELVHAEVNRLTEIAAATTSIEPRSVFFFDYQAPPLDEDPEAETAEITFASVPKRASVTLPQLSKARQFLRSHEQRAALELYNKNLEPIFGSTGTTMLFYYIDGERTIHEIAALLDIDLDISARDEVLEAMQVFYTLGYIELVPSWEGYFM